MDVIDGTIQDELNRVEPAKPKKKAKAKVKPVKTAPKAKPKNKKANRTSGAGGKRKPKPKKQKAGTVVRSERLDMRLTKAEKAKITTRAKKTRRTVTSLIIEAIEKIR